MRAKRCLFACLMLGIVISAVSPASAFAQGKSKKGDGATVNASAFITLTNDMQSEIRSWYSLHPEGNVEALPPGIQKRLARGKPLPPGIAKKVAPSGLQSRVRVPDGYELIEVGLDVLLVEVATSIVHDILMDAVR